MMTTHQHNQCYTFSTLQEPVKVLQADFIKSAPTLEDCPDVAAFQPEIALVGRSNVGKSSWINKMLNRKQLAKTSNTPGKTRMINVYHITVEAQALQCHYQADTTDTATEVYTPHLPATWWMMDLPGYGYARVSKVEQAKWQRELERYLRHRPSLSTICLLLDSRHGLKPNDAEMLRWLLHYKKPLIVVLTKADKCTQSELTAMEKAVRQQLKAVTNVNLPIVRFSAETGFGVHACWDVLSSLPQNQA
ncbi:MAG: GTP-binding protein [Vampirovibrionales bacterium]